MRWLAIRVSGAEAAGRELVIAALIAAGGGAVLEDGDALVTYLPEETDLEPVRAALTSAGPAVSLGVHPLGQVDWQSAWRPQVGVHRVGRLTTAPPWRADEAGDAAMAILVEPAMAFGTGEHASTRGALRLLEGALRRGDRVADLGAGSGILAIASAKLGASRVAAIENDPQAIGNLQENVDRNGVANVVTVLEGDAGTLLPLVAPVEMITANIVSSVITQLLPVIESALSVRGRVIVAGIMIEERDAIREVFGQAGWRVAREDLEEKWWAAGLERHDRPITGAHPAAPPPAR